MFRATRRLDSVALARLACLTITAPVTVLSIGFFFRSDWAMNAWAWPEAKMSYVFLAAIGAATVGALVWVAISGDVAALAPGAINTTVSMMLGSVYFGQRGIRQDDGEMLIWAAICLGYGIPVFRIYLWSRSRVVLSTMPTPTYVRWFFLGAASVLAVVGFLAYVQLPHIYPWDVQSGTSSLFGALFLGAASVFVYGLARPVWAFAAGNLWAFLAYDIILLIPYIAMIGDDSDSTTGGGYYDYYGGGTASTSTGDGVNVPSLVIYLTVISLSLLVICYTLFVRPQTRIHWRPIEIRPHGLGIREDA
jgi:hypothetical protein